MKRVLGRSYRGIQALGVAAALTCTAMSAHADISTGLLAWYGFENNTNDSSGAARNGTPTAITYTAGRLGSAASFDDATSKVEVASLAGVLPAGNSPRTVAFWVNPANTASNGNIVSWGTNAPGQRFSPLMQAGGRLDMIGAFADVASTQNLAASTWTHVVVTYTGTNVQFYVNGASVAAAGGGAVALNTISNTLRIGVNALGTDNEYFGGLIDEVRIYNRVLSAADVTELFNSTAVAGAATGVPTLAHGALGLLSLVIGGLGMLRQRKRQAA